MRRLRLAFWSGVGLVASGLLFAAPTVACSPPFDPTIAALGPNHMVMVGTTGERVQGGRLFHVDRTFNVDSNITPIVIAFKEGEPIGDCSYPVNAGTHLIIAPERAPDGRLTANLATLQADPDSEAGRRYLAEAESLFGPGMVPAVSAVADLPIVRELPPVGLIVVVGFALLLGVIAGIAWWRSRVRSAGSSRGAGR